MSASRRRMRGAGMLLLPLALGACPDTFTNFTRQPKVDPWEVATMDSTKLDSTPPRGNPQGSVPMFGGSPPEFLVSYGRFPLTVDSMSSLRNPTPPSDSSLANGRKYFSINCAVCHGDTGAGNGAVTKYNFPQISLLSASALGRSDGYIYGMIRNGRGLMPTYNRIESMDRWDVVNYVRGLQGRLGRTVPTGPLGIPGETGVKVPGPTLTAPTRPSPHYRPGMIAAPTAPRDTISAGPAGAAPGRPGGHQ